MMFHSVCFAASLPVKPSSYTGFIPDEGSFANRVLIYNFAVHDSGTVTEYDNSTGKNYWTDAGSSAATGCYRGLSRSDGCTDYYFFFPTVTSQVYNFVMTVPGGGCSVYLVNKNGVIIKDLTDNILDVELGDYHTYGVSFYAANNWYGVCFAVSHSSSTAPFYGEFMEGYYKSSYFDSIIDNLPYMPGFYDGTGTAVRYMGYDVANVTIPSMGLGYAVFPTFVGDLGGSGATFTFKFHNPSVSVKSDKLYTLNYSSILDSLIISIDGNDYVHALDSGYSASEATHNFDLSFTPTSTSLADLNFTLKISLKHSGFVLEFVSSSSTDIGVTPTPGGDDDSGSSGGNYSSALSNISSQLDDLLSGMGTNTTTIVNNITNATTTITNTITNTVTQMTTNITNALSDVKQGISDTIDSAKESINTTLNGVKDDINGKLDQVQNSVNDAVEKQTNSLLDGLKNFFIPSDDFFKSYFDDLSDFFADRFGFLSLPFELVGRVVDVFSDASSADFVVTLPALTIMGESIWSDQSFNLTDLIESDFGFLIVASHTVTNIILLFWFINLCTDKWNEVMNL